jgi:hypothetical protein
MSKWLTLNEAIARACLHGLNSSAAHDALIDGIQNGHIASRITTNTRKYPKSIGPNGEVRDAHELDVEIETLNATDIDAWVKRISPHQLNKGGRPRNPSWDDFYTEIICIANTVEGLPSPRARLIKQMLEWCSSNWSEEPGESVVEQRIYKIYNAAKKHKN